MRITIVSRDDSGCYRRRSRHGFRVFQVLMVVETVRQRRCCGFAPQSAVCNMRVHTRTVFAKVGKAGIGISDLARLKAAGLSI